MNRSIFLFAAMAAFLSPAIAQSPPAHAPASIKPLEKVVFATNWLAEGEHGGHYQAVVDGTYARYGLDVKIVPGGPQTNNRLLLVAGKVDFYMSANLIATFTALEQNVPVLAVAAMFQKDPFILMSHPGQGLDTWADLNKGTIFIGAETRATVFQWLKQEFGFRDDRLKPYAFNPQPFIADKKSIQQGYATSEPFAVEQAGKFRPNVFLAADYGFDTYSTLIEARRETIENRPDLVQRFVEASIIGWYNYIYHDNAAANALIKRENPDMTDAQIAFTLAKMKESGIVDSGESLTKGIGAMSHERISGFYAKMSKAGVVRPGLELSKGYTLDFVNRGVGLELRPKN